MTKYLATSLKKNVGDKDPTRLTEDRKNLFGSGTGYFYQTGIVKEFIGEPDVYLKVRKGKLPRVSNGGDYEIMTKNCLIAYLVDISGLPVICYPFFPHMSLPIKVGEHVWLLKEEFHGRDVYYWLSRKTGIKQTDDLNYTHAERFSLIESKLNENNPNNKKEKTNLFDDESVSKIDESAYTSFDNKSQSNLPRDISTSMLADSSFSYKREFTAEPVPPVRRKCGDTLILGSNNSLVHLTTEKFKTNTLNRKDFTGLLTEPNIEGRYPFSPAIDLCVGRKKLELDQLKNTTTDKAQAGEVRIVKAERGSLYSELENYEIDKIGNLLDKNREFFSGLSTDFEATNCGARLYLSNNCAIDETFGSAISDLPTLGGSSIVTYADHNRVVADESLRLTNRLGQSFLDMDSEGKVRLQGKTKIELAVREDNESPTEPYILHSELAPLLKKLSGDAAYANFILDTLLQALAKVPPIAPILSPIVEALNAARDLRDSGASAQQSESFEIPATSAVFDEEGNETSPATPPIPSSISLEAAGNNITQDNIQEEAINVIDINIKSEKIFGE